MGIYDRDYYREPDDSWWPEARGRRATLGLMLLLGVVFVMQVVGSDPRHMGPDPILTMGAFDVPKVLSGQVWRLFTAHIVHAPSGLLQLALELFALYLFGSRIESIYGTREYIAFLLTAALVISLAKLAGAMGGVDQQSVTYGAGGLITAIMVVFACHFPHERINILFIPIPAYVLVAVIVAMDVLGAVGGGFGSAGHVGHVIGAAFGFAYHFFQWRISLVLFPRWLSSSRTNKAKHLKLFQEDADSMADDSEPLAPPSPTVTKPIKATAKQSTVTVDEQLEAKLDLVLAKVSRSGRESLSPDEREILQQASEIYQRRRRN